MSNIKQASPHSPAASENEEPFSLTLMMRFEDRYSIERLAERAGVSVDEWVLDACFKRVHLELEREVLSAVYALDQFQGAGRQS